MKKIWNKIKYAVIPVIISLIVISPFDLTFKKNEAGELKPSFINPPALANNQFIPTNGTLRTGTEATISSATAASSNGVNVGSWKGTLADDNFHWMIDSTASGYDLNLTVGGVQLKGANTMMIQTEIDLDATVPQTFFQICDWASNTGVDAEKDSDCNPAGNGGWRILNLRKGLFGSATSTALHYQIYDGYWSDGNNTPISTPLSNFVSPSNEVKIRYYSNTVNSTSPVAIDYLRIYTVINPVYSPAGLTNNTVGITVGDYTDAILALGQTYSDNIRSGARSDGSSPTNFYWTFKNAETYTGMNTIVIRAETGCNSSGISYRPQIYNDTLSSWEDVSTNDIACSATDATNIWSFVPTTLNDYISAGNEIKIGFRATTNTDLIIQADFIYIILGTTNTDSSKCEISFGTGTTSDCANTRDLDSTSGSPSTWQITTEDESTNQGHNYYPMDNDQDSVAEEAGSSHVKFSVTQPANSAVTGLFFASRHMSGAGGTVQASLRDYSGSYATTASGGFTDVGGTATTSLIYTDNITSASVSSVGVAGVINNPEDYLNSVGSEVWMRLRTSADGATTNNSVNQWDFAFVSLQWIEDANHPSNSYQFTPTAGSATNGTEQNINGLNGSTAQGRNTGWTGALADDNYHWEVAGDTDGTPGLTMNFTLGNAQLNGANAILIESELDLDPTLPVMDFQICDWASNTGVDAGVDGVCNPATGGWRSYTPRRATWSYEATSTSTASVHHFQIYNGYWSDGSNNPIDTPLSNFINGSNEIKIRYISTTSTTSVVSVDYLRVFAVINPIYSPAGFTATGAGAVTGDYTNATIGILSSYMPSGSDDVYSGSLAVAGETEPNSYWSFKNIETYTGMNTAVIRTAHSCASATTALYRPKVYNFTTATWTDISTGSLPCSTSDEVNSWAFTPSAPYTLVDDYISSGEMRFGFILLSGNPTTFRADYIYMILGTTNTDSSKCEISFGTGTATDCVNTRNLDTSGTISTWDIAKEDESTDFSHDYYPYDNDADIDLEEAAAGHIAFSITTPTGTGTTGIFFSQGAMGGLGYNELGSGRTYGNIRDYSGFSGTSGGFTNIGGNLTTSMAYGDNVTIAAVGNAGASGITTNPEDYYDADNNEMRFRFRSYYSGGIGNNLATKIDFAMMSPQWIESSSNATPNLPTNLGPAGYVDAAGWTNVNTPTLTFDLSDGDAGQQVKYRIQISSTSDFSVIDVDYTSALADQGSFSFTVGQAAGGGTYNNGSEGVGLSDSMGGTGYYWRVKAIDALNAESAYEEAGTDAQIDFRVDTMGPFDGGYVYDGLAGDQDWNDGSLQTLEANWAEHTDSFSGVNHYEYAIQRSSDNYYWDSLNGWQLVESWTNNNLNTTVTVNNINLNTGENYYFTVRSYDNVGNMRPGSILSSNGQQVLPLLSFSVSTNSINFANLNNGNSWTDSQVITTTTSSNAAYGYTIKVYNTQTLTSSAYPSKTITDFSGTWASPAPWSGTGFGYTSSDDTVQGSDRFDGGANYAAFSQSYPGDVVADHTDIVNGSTGAANEQFNITYKVTAPQDQSASTYETNSIYTVTANY